jgi:hypothetical protein
MTKLINLTPHTIRYKNPDGIVDLLSSGTVARVEVSQVRTGVLNGVDVCTNVYGDITGVPTDVDDDVVFVVSGMVLNAVKSGDTRFVAPDTGPTAVRNASGHISYVVQWVAK